MKPLPSAPLPDPRNRCLVPDYEGMHVLVAELVVPGDASMYVMSALETSRELLRHSYFRYEFATAAVTHSLFALEHVLAERLAVKEPLHALIERATDTGLVPADLAARLDRSRQLRDELTQGAVTSADLNPTRGIALLRAVFDAVTLLVGPRPAAQGAEGEAADPGTEPLEARLARLAEEHRRALYPDSFRGVDIGGVELILLDADVAGLVHTELNGGLDDNGIAALWGCIADLDTLEPLIDSEYCASYFGRLRALARLAVARHIPAAT
ncbi:hypothetical protein ACIA8F_04130 [Streptomyces sp. NPDC051563]|uniref:hypothetical protein n=1 Tax=Streptomyces sp. NPDC051563 TaxID=3365659 RepID=UPI0037BD0F7B